jgi:hypothetical protein
MTTKLTDLTLSAKSMRASCCCASNATILDFWYSNNNGVQGIFPAEMTSFITEFMYQVGKMVVGSGIITTPHGSKVSIL